jgi:hypothetical protein
VVFAKTFQGVFVFVFVLTTMVTAGITIVSINEEVNKCIHSFCAVCAYCALYWYPIDLNDKYMNVPYQNCLDCEIINTNVSLEGT